MQSTRREAVVSAVLVLMTFSLGFAEFVLIGIVGDVAGGIGADLTSVGNIVGYCAVACAVGTPIIALATSRVPRRLLFVVLLALFNAGNLATLVVDAYWPLVLSRLLPAVAGGTLITLCMTIVPDVVRKERTALVLSLVLAGYSVSSVVGVPLGTLLGSAYGWRAAYIAVFACGVVSSVALVAVLPQNNAAQQGAGIAEQLRLLADPRILLVVAMMVFVAGSTYVFYTYMTPILQDVMGYGPAMTSIALGAFGVACVVSNLISGKVANGPGIKGLPAIFTVHGLLLMALPATIGLGFVGIANMVLVGLVMYAMNSTVQMFFQRVARGLSGSAGILVVAAPHGIQRRHRIRLICGRRRCGRAGHDRHRPRWRSHGPVRRRDGACAQQVDAQSSAGRTKVYPSIKKRPRTIWVRGRL